MLNVQRIKQRGESERASFPHGLPGQARQRRHKNSFPRRVVAPSFAEVRRSRVGKGATRRAHVFCSFIRVGFASARTHKAPHADPEKWRSVFGQDHAQKTGKRSAERRIVLPMSASSAACVPSARPPFGAHACGTRHRLLPRWLSSRTGFPAAAANGCFSRFANQKMPRLSTLRADRSLCRSTGDPKPPGSGSAKNPRAGTAPRLRCFGMPSGTAPCTKRGFVP